MPWIIFVGYVPPVKLDRGFSKLLCGDNSYGISAGWESDGGFEKQVLDWSSQSSDLNPTEHAFYLLNFNIFFW